MTIEEALPLLVRLTFDPDGEQEWAVPLSFESEEAYRVIRKATDTTIDLDSFSGKFIEKYGPVAQGTHAEVATWLLAKYQEKYPTG